jgi:hypothetical protein
VERAEGPDGVAASTQSVNQAVVLKASEGVRSGGRRAFELGPGFGEGELLFALGYKRVDQFERSSHRCIPIGRIAEIHRKREEG